MSVVYGASSTASLCMARGAGGQSSVADDTAMAACCCQRALRSAIWRSSRSLACVPMTWVSSSWLVKGVWAPHPSRHPVEAADPGLKLV